MTYRVRNIGIALALAAIAALLTSVYVTSYKRHVQSGQDQVTVYVAKQDINRGTTGGEAAKLLSTQEVPKRTLVPGAITKPDQLTGLVATQPTLQGEQVTTRRFSTVSRNGVRAELTGTDRALAFSGDQTQLLAGTLQNGDHVDLVASLACRRKRGGLRVHARRPTQPEGAPGAGFARRGQLEADEQPGLHRHAQDDRQPVAEVPARPDGRRPRPHRELAPGAAPRHPRRRQPGEHHHQLDDLPRRAQPGLDQALPARPEGRPVMLEERTQSERRSDHSRARPDLRHGRLRRAAGPPRDACQPSGGRARRLGPAGGRGGADPDGRPPPGGAPRDPFVDAAGERDRRDSRVHAGADRPARLERVPGPARGGTRARRRRRPAPAAADRQRRLRDPQGRPRRQAARRAATSGTAGS